MNYLKTTLLLAAMTGLFLAVGWLLGGTGGMVMAFLFAIALNGFAWWNSDKLVLRMQHAREISPYDSGGLHNMVGHLARKAGLPMPKLYLIDTDQPNAFATGRDPAHAAVAVTRGLLTMLERDEIEGVVAHELAHIKNRDTLIMTLTAVVAGAISMLANFALFFGGGDNRNNPLGIIGVILIMIFAPMAALLVQMAISRTREYGADHLGAEITGKPRALASALAKIDRAARNIRNDKAEANPASAHLFIMNPLSGERMDNLFSTHPATENRIAALEAMAGGPGAGRASHPYGPVGRSGIPGSGKRRASGPSSGPWA